VIEGIAALHNGELIKPKLVEAENLAENAASGNLIKN